jgi:predicted transposase YbfD/YdcC
MVVGGNQPTLLADLDLLFADRALVQETGSYAVRVGAGHGRIERREPWASTALVGYTAWPGLAQALCTQRTIRDKHTGKERHERAYAVTSLPPSRAQAPALLRLWQEHWAIENRLHWVRDVTLGEDASRVRSEAAPQVLAVVRNTVLGLLRVHGYRAIAATRRHLARRPRQALALCGLRC